MYKSLLFVAVLVVAANAFSAADVDRSVTRRGLAYANSLAASAPITLANYGAPVSRANANDPCSSVTTCTTCGTTAGCVWAFVEGLQGPANNPTGYGATPQCVTGTAAGPDRTRNKIWQMDFFDTTFTPFWTNNCDQPYRMANIDTTGNTNKGEAHKGSIEILSSFRWILTARQYQAIVAAGPEGSQARERAFVDTFVTFFRGIPLFYLEIGALAKATDADDLARSGLHVFYFGLDLEAFLTGVVRASRDPSFVFNPFSGSAKAVAFFVAFDSINRYAYTAGQPQTAATTLTASTLIQNLQLSALGASAIINSATVNKYVMTGSLSDSSTFTLQCYLAVNPWTYYGRTVSPNDFECDVLLGSLPTTAGQSVGMRVVVVALDVKGILAGSGSASQGRAGSNLDISIGNAGYFRVAAQANASLASTGFTPINVLATVDPECASVAWVTPALRAGISRAFNGLATTYCQMYSFDVDLGSLKAQAAVPGGLPQIFWDPQAGVDQTVANKQITSKLSQTNAASTAGPAAVMMLLALLAALVF
eukprot:c45582_g1_i1.p1 GENE.c45582_g1_i1~~c45582_g1_i1.p1  ORF type:complete len:547 (-),score=109.95 c45582_g1_i1:36-1646(-)